MNRLSSDLSAKVANLPAHLQYTKLLPKDEQKQRAKADREQNTIRFFANVGKLVKFLTFQSSTPNFTKSNHETRMNNRALSGVPATYSGYQSKLADASATDRISDRA